MKQISPAILLYNTPLQLLTGNTARLMHHGSAGLCTAVIITFLFFTGSLAAQTTHPGGVAGAKAWFVTRALSPTHNYSRWVDKSGNGLVLRQGDNSEFHWDDKEHNFHKSLLFYRDDVYFDLPGSSGRQLTTFGLFNPYQYTYAQASEYLLYDVLSINNSESFNMATDKVYTPGGAIHLRLWSRARQRPVFSYRQF